jgi:hypothetical protein
MTRINVVHPSLLTRQHLLAEWHEIGRIITLAEGGVDPKDIPERYTLGKGHMKFFADKLGYITLRTGWLAKEMRHRGYQADQRKQIDGVGRVIGLGFGPLWQPDKTDLTVNLCRLIERAPDHRPYREEYDAIMEYAL